MFAEPSFIEKRLAKAGSTISPTEVTKIDIFNADKQHRNMNSQTIDTNPLQQITDAYAKLIKSSPPRVGFNKKQEISTHRSGSHQDKLRKPGHNLLMKQLLKSRFKEIKSLQQCDLLAFMEPLRILKEETKCIKSDLEGFLKDLLAATGNHSFVSREKFMDELWKYFGRGSEVNGLNNKLF